MNLPNKLTLLRIILVPFFVLFLLSSQIPLNSVWALLTFIIASITDFLDGYIARKYNMITDFGKFADPLADKILVVSAFCCFIEMGIMGAIPLIIVLFREFAVTSVRLVAASKGRVVSANMWGKAKTVSQLIAIISILFMQILLQITGITELGFIFDIVTQVVIWVSVILTIISGIVYLKDNADVYINAK